MSKWPKCSSLVYTYLKIVQRDQINKYIGGKANEIDCCWKYHQLQHVYLADINTIRRARATGNWLSITLKSRIHGAQRGTDHCESSTTHTHYTLTGSRRLFRRLTLLTHFSGERKERRSRKKEDFYNISLLIVNYCTRSCGEMWIICQDVLWKLGHEKIKALMI